MSEDVVYPAEIVGKHFKYRLDGSKIIKIFLDHGKKNNTEYKLDTESILGKTCFPVIQLQKPKELLQMVNSIVVLLQHYNYFE